MLSTHFFTEITTYTMTQNSSRLFALCLMTAIFTQTSCDPFCKFDQNDYLGSYTIQESCSTSPPAVYDVTILKGAAENEVKLTNFWDTFQGVVYATIDCETITILRQEPDGDKYFIEGWGFLEQQNGVTTITWSYTITDENTTPFVKEECQSTIYTKQ
jgi:hypothetical protein